MKKIHLALIIFAFISCNSSDNNGNETSSNNQETNTEEESRVLIDSSSPDSLIAGVIRERKKSIGDEYEISIQGNIFFEDNDYAIINFQEDHENTQYLYAVVLNAYHKPDDSNLDGVVGDVSLLLQNLETNWAVYEGNFEEIDQLSEELNFVLLASPGGYRMSVENFSQIYTLENQMLAPTAVSFFTSGEGGECDFFQGISERFSFDQQRNWIKIKREENVFEGCELLGHFVYHKIWDLNQSPSLDSHPNYIQTGFSLYEDISSFPRALYKIYVNNGDTMMIENEELVLNKNTFESEPMNWAISYRTTHDAFDALVVYFEKVNDNEFFFVERAYFGGPSAANDLFYGQNLIEEEQAGKYTFKTLKLLDPSGIYMLSSDNMELLYTADKSRFELQADENDYDF